ncbi:PTS system, cellobiose-specific IIB component [Lentibacillus halodurans]|uniref:PTS system, cellobiose-specific IIB component n=1 Tax=Lentibacillus halodurans TaxID=237679 RepID=A0A1I0ZPZ0_9BACI|nr:PTS sugar transporter subunit IIB [Lentibacillus halodurans]SFB27176.1 PTS system, cellobiose-specific IIB component [Lentibacillus halodurans]
MKIALVCSAGMSTSMLVNKMRKSAEEREIKVEIDAFAEADLKNNLDQLDVVLIGPQVRYLEKQIRQHAEPKGIKVGIIDQMAYGMIKGEKVLDQAIELKNA